MAAECYVVKKSETTITNTKDTCQAAWPRWTPSAPSTCETTVITYEEWEGTVGWPLTENVFEVITDDLIINY